MAVAFALLLIINHIALVSSDIDGENIHTHDEEIDGYCYDLWIGNNHSDKEKTECGAIVSLLDCHNTPGCKWTSSLTMDEQREILNGAMSFEEDEESERHYPRKPAGNYSTVFIVINTLAGVFIILLISLTFCCCCKAFTNVANNTSVSDSTPLLP